MGKNSVRPCGHMFCNICVRRLDRDTPASSSTPSPDDITSGSSAQTRNWVCPKCASDVSYVAGFSGPMNLPGEETLKAKVPVHVLKVEDDGRIKFKSINKTRL